MLPSPPFPAWTRCERPSASSRRLSGILPQSRHRRRPTQRVACPTGCRLDIFDASSPTRRSATNDQRSNATSGSLGFVHLAEAYRLEGLLDDAGRILREGLAVNPASIPGRLALARLLLLQGKLEEAHGEAERLEVLSPGMLEVLELRTELLLRRRGGESSGRSTATAKEPPLSGPSLATPTLQALYAAQGYARRAEAVKDRLQAGSTTRDSVPTAPRAMVLERLAAFREAARRRRGARRP